MIVTVPADTPVTIPLEEPIVANKGLLLLHVPPAVPSNKVSVSPTHTKGRPSMEGGKGFTVTVIVAKQPPGNV